MRDVERAAAAAAERARVDIGVAAAAAKKAAEERDCEKRTAAAAKARETRLDHEVRRLEIQGVKVLQRLNVLLLQKIARTSLELRLAGRCRDCPAEMTKERIDGWSMPAAAAAAATGLTVCIFSPRAWRSWKADALHLQTKTLR